MSRVAKNPVSIPSGVEIMLDEKSITVSGSRGKSEFTFPDSVSATHADDLITVSYDESSSESIALAGTTRSLINNMIIGVSEGFKKELQVIGVGYRAVAKGQLLELALGFSHAVVLEIPSEIKVSAQTEKGKAPIVTLESHDKQLLGQVASKIRSLRKPEPYKGKGIRYMGEEVRRKAGKAASK